MFPTRVRDYRPGMRRRAAGFQATWCGRALAAKATRARGMGGRAASQLPRARSQQASSRSLSHRFAVRARTARSGRCAVRRPKPEGSAAPSVDAAVVEALGSEAACSSARSSMRAPTACARVRRRGGRSLHHARAHVGRARDERHVRARCAPRSKAGRCCGQAAQRAASTRGGAAGPPWRTVDSPTMRGIASAHGRGGRGSDGAVVAHHAAPENDTVRAIALVESILDRYGVLSRDGGAAGRRARGLAALLPVLRQMEDVGDVRARRVRAGHSAPRSSARAHDHATCCSPTRRATARPNHASPSCSPRRSACLYGAGLLAAGRARRCRGRGEHEARPTRRAGSLVVGLAACRRSTLRRGCASLLSSRTTETRSPGPRGPLVRTRSAALRRRRSRMRPQEGGRGNAQRPIDPGFPVAEVLARCGLVRLSRRHMRTLRLAVLTVPTASAAYDAPTGSRHRPRTRKGQPEGGRRSYEVGRRDLEPAQAGTKVECDN